MDFQSTVSIRDFYAFDGQPIDFEWNLFQGRTSLELLQKIYGDLQRRNIDPDNLEIDVSSCPCPTTLISQKKTMKNNAFEIPKKSEIMRRDSCEDIGRPLDLEVKKSGMIHTCQGLNRNGTP